MIDAVLGKFYKYIILGLMYDAIYQVYKNL